MKTLLRTICLLAFVAACSLPVWATDVTLSAFQIKDWNYGGSTLKLRLYSSDTWTDSLGYVRGSGIAGSQTGFFKEIICPISGTTATCPTFVLPSTVDSIDVPQVRITGSLFSENNSFKMNLFQNWRIPAITPTTWSDLVLFNRAQPKPLGDVYYTAPQVDAKILEATGGGGSAPLATDVIPGKGRLSVTAASVSDPIFVGDNDPRLVGGVISVVCAGVDDTVALNAAIATGGTVVITRGSTCAASSSLTFTTSSTAVLRVEKGGLFKPITGQTPVVGGYIDAGAYQIFTNALAGQGTVSFNGYVLQDVHPEWWGALGDASTISTAPLQASIIGAYGSNRTNGSGLWKYNRTLKFSGRYAIDQELQCYHMIGFLWRGATKFNSGIIQTATNKRIIDGQSVTYGVFDNLIFSSNASQGNGMALVDLDYDASQGSDLRPQNLTFQDCIFAGNNVSNIGAWIAKHSGSQGDNVRFRNCYGSGFTFAVAVLGGNPAVAQMGANCSYNQNALNVIWDGGDLQGNPQYGLAAYGGNWIVNGTTFENGSAGVFTQTGFDVYCEAPGEPCSMSNTLHESMKIAAGVKYFRNVTQQGRPYNWWPTNSLGASATFLDQPITGSAVGGDGRIYRVTVAGTLGGLNSTTATGGSSTTLVKAGAGWTVNAFLGYRVAILSGSGALQYGIITANDATTLTVAGGWVTQFKDIAITSPNATSTFVVEPNWGTQFTSGTTTFALYSFNVIEGGLGSIGNVDIDGMSISYGGQLKVGSSSNLRNMSVIRSDWLWQVGNSNIPLDDTPVNFRTENIYASNIDVAGNLGNLPWKIVRNGFVSTPFTDLTQRQQGTQWTLFDQGQPGGGLGYGQVGVGRGDGTPDNGGVPGRNILGYLGMLGRPTPFGTNQPGAATQIQGGLSTGSATAGAIEGWLGSAGSSGSTVNAGSKVFSASRATGFKLFSISFQPAISTSLATTTPVDVGSVLLLGNIVPYTPTQSSTIDIASVPTQEFTLMIVTSGTTSYTLTFNTNFKTTGTLATGTVSGKVFTMRFACDGTRCAEISRTTAM